MILLCHNTLAKSYDSKVGLIIQKRCILVTVFAALLLPILLYACYILCCSLVTIIAVFLVTGYICIMKKYNFFKQDAVRPTEEQRLQTKLFYENAREIYSRFDEWKDDDRFYFIPLYYDENPGYINVFRLVSDTPVDVIIPIISHHDNLHSYYNLQGRKVTHPTHGIYITNGRKIIIK